MDPKTKKEIPRQGGNSPHALMDPPRGIPDPYGWMRDEKREDPEVLNFLETENAYGQALTKHLEPLRTDLYDEMLSSIKETDFSCPVGRGEYWYYSRTFKGKSYTTYCRAPRVSRDVEFDASKWDGTAECPVLEGEEVYLDVNKLAEGKKYCSVGVAAVSRNHEYLAYTLDETGGETCTLQVLNLATGETLDHDPKLECDGSVSWNDSHDSVFYIQMDEAHRPYRVYRRKVVGRTDDEPEDELLYEEPDELYWVSISKTFDGKFLLARSSSKETAEVHYLDLRDPASKLECISPRRKKVLYRASHRNGSWMISTNVGGTPNMKLMTCRVGESDDAWQMVEDKNGDAIFSGGLDRSLEGVTVFDGSRAVITGREGGMPRVFIADFGDDGADGSAVVAGGVERLEFDETAYDVGLGGNREPESDSVVVAYDSLVTPTSSIRVPLSDTSLSARVVLKTKEVPGYDRDLYACERTTVKSRDGMTDIPVSLVYAKDAIKEGEAVPCHLYGYGSYGACIEASFSVTRFPLLKRGVVYVIAHVRGGSEMGRQWYEEPNGAKYLCKMNTFNDFVDVARYLIDDRKLTVPAKLSCEGRSAGGLLIGASINQAPDLFRAAVLGVPFVDVACTMVDATIPLTVVEWEEWGNPNEEEFFEYMMSYSPMNNVREGGVYPACLLTGGLHDPRVQYWEPAKFAAELRHKQSEKSGPVVLKIDMAAGHFSASDRYKYVRELAFDYAFLLDQLGLAGEK